MGAGPAVWSGWVTCGLHSAGTLREPALQDRCAKSLQGSAQQKQPQKPSVWLFCTEITHRTAAYSVSDKCSLCSEEKQVTY